jgi:hypothetical protein
MTRLPTVFTNLLMLVLFLLALGSSGFALLTFSFGSGLLSLALWVALALVFFLKRILEELSRVRRLQEKQVRWHDEAMEELTSNLETLSQRDSRERVPTR